MKIRKAVRCFCFVDGNIVNVFEKDESRGYFDLPGGKIEEGESSLDAVSREFREETGATVTDPIFKGTLDIIYPDKIFSMNIFIAEGFEGKLVETEKHIAGIMSIDELLAEEKTLPCIQLLKPENIDLLFNEGLFTTEIDRTGTERVLTKKELT